MGGWDPVSERVTCRSRRRPSPRHVTIHIHWMIVAESPSTVTAAPAAFADLYVFFRNVIAAVKEQDDTEYMTLGRMNLVCSHCGALHWIKVMISVTISPATILYIDTDSTISFEYEYPGACRTHSRQSTCLYKLLARKSQMPAIVAPPAELQDLL